NLVPFDNVLAIYNFGYDQGKAGNGVLIVDEDPSLCQFGFICFAMGLGHGLPRSDSQAGAGDAWDLMSFPTFPGRYDVVFRGATGKGCPGLNARNVEALR